LTPNATNAAIKGGGASPGVSGADVLRPAGEKVDLRARKRSASRDYMRVHTLEGTGGKTYAPDGRAFATDDGTGTNEASQAQQGTPTARQQSHGARRHLG
jgi:hypothetical protein